VPRSARPRFSRTRSPCACADTQHWTANRHRPRHARGNLQQRDRAVPAPGQLRSRHRRSQARAKDPRASQLSNDDIQVTCPDVDHLARGLARAHATVDSVRLLGVDHVLKQDSSRTTAYYTKPLPFSSQLRAALRAFVSANL